jgi:hypothetical protein
MKTSAILAIATLLAAVAGIHGSCLAGEKTGAGARSIVSELAGSAVPTAELNSEHARGGANIKIDAASASGGNGSSFDNGQLHGNSVIGTSATGTITTTGSVNNNMGITTVFQNSGNNSPFQQSTAINITLQ